MTPAASARLRAGLDEHTSAARLSITTPYLRRVERTAVPWVLAQRMCRVYRCGLSDLLPGGGTRHSDPRSAGTEPTGARR